MRILFLAHRLPYPPNKGDKIRSFWELRCLSERHQVDVACFYDQAEDARELEKAAKYCDSMYCEKLDPLAARIRSGAAVLRRQPFTIGYFHSRKMDAAIRSILRAKRPDLIFVFSSAMAHYVMNVPNVPKVLDMVDVDSEKWAQYARGASVLFSWLGRYEARHLAEHESEIVRHFSATCVCTESERELLRSVSGDSRIRVMGNVLDAGYFDPENVSIPAEIAGLQPYVVFTGSMDYLPNVDAVKFFAREILPLARERVPDLKFVIAGMNPSREVKRLAAPGEVIVTGSVPDIRPYLRGAAAAVISMRLSRGIQNKVLEALAMGVPVLTTSRVAATIPADIASFLLCEDEPRAFAARLAGVVSSGFRPALAQVRRALAQEYGSDRLAEKLENLLSVASSASAGETRRAEAVLS